MESNNRAFLAFVLISLLILAGAGWYLQTILNQAVVQKEGSQKKTDQFKQEFGTGMTLEELNLKFGEQINHESDRLRDYKKSVYFQFPDWVKKGEELTKRGQRGEYFIKMKASEIGRLINVCGHECDIDVNQVIEHIGFPNNAAPADDLAPSELRRLAIITKTIDLAAHAKLEQSQADLKDKIKSSAYMKIVSVDPLKPEYTGADRLDPNPKFKENEHSFRNNRFLVVKYPYFMIEYPIELKMVCDINTFRRFLTSSRRPNEYLIIRNIRIRSGTLKYSQEGSNDLPGELSDANTPDDVGSELVFIELSAAGVEFIQGHRFEEKITQPLDLTDYQPGFAPAAPATAAPGQARAHPVGA
ncbi:MAG TPA: hypothetical protein VL860_05640 [Planctomycetota bacterium]|nr:hypothetical protein [Planctomycetota bacterium]